MVMQHNRSKTSNAGLDIYKIPDRYKIQSRILYTERRPKTTELHPGYLIATYDLSASGASDWIVPSQWKVPPHVRLANLPAYDQTGKMIMLPQPNLRVDANDVATFIRTYGLLRGKTSLEEMQKRADPDEIQALEALPGGVPDKEFFERFGLGPVWLIYREEVREFADAQHMLRQAWAEPATANIVPISAQASEGFKIQPFHPDGLVVETHNLWSLICFMFMCDHKAGKIGVCACPTCVTPYFLKRRKTQKFCESGPCVAWAASQYSLKWWRKKRSKTKGERRKQK